MHPVPELNLSPGSLPLVSGTSLPPRGPVSESAGTGLVSCRALSEHHMQWNSGDRHDGLHLLGAEVKGVLEEEV